LALRKYHALKIKAPVEYLLLTARRRAAVKGVPFTITAADIDLPKFCPVLGMELSTVGSGAGADAPSLDRIRPALGYVPGNVAVISHRANTIKSFGTAEEHERIAAWMRTKTP
jgi:hypothetical protein